MAAGRDITVKKEIVRAARRQRAMRLEQARRARWAHRMRRLRRAFLAAAAIVMATFVAALVMGGLPFTTTLLAILLAMVAFAVLAFYPPSPRPRADQLGSAELAELAASTELWLESRRRALPAPALDAVDMIGVRLEQLQPQLQTLDANGPPRARCASCYPSICPRWSTAIPAFPPRCAARRMREAPPMRSWSRASAPSPTRSRR
ncbi:hypothetical protein [Novosphingobium sp. 9]|uniref:hypothetical protein n=1 Tax=Novosphingobium sp. 9 TaxID=2025349 RepID=UPI0021B67D37|nr:hypothetical protein [Novosphingobium sp. 9]